MSWSIGFILQLSEGHPRFLQWPLSNQSVAGGQWLPFARNCVWVFQVTCGKPITQFSGKEKPTLLLKKKSRILKPAHSSHCCLVSFLGRLPVTLLLGCVNPHVPLSSLLPFLHWFRQMSTLCLGWMFRLVHPLVYQPGRTHRIPVVCNLPKRRALSTFEHPLWVLVSRFIRSTRLFVLATRLHLANSDSPFLVTIQWIMSKEPHGQAFGE